MNTHTPRPAAPAGAEPGCPAMFAAILFLLTFTPIGMIDLPIIKATVLHVPVIIGASFSDPRREPFWAACLVLASLLKNTLVPNLSSFAFSP